MDLLKQAKDAAAKLADQTEDKSGNFEYTPPAAGPCVARFISYIEIGKQPQRAYQGKEKPPALEAIVEFELLGKKHAKEIEFEDETGATVKKTIYPVIRERIAVKSGAKAAFFKLLKAMDYGRGNTHMAFMLGEAFKLNIVHNEVEKDGQKKVYANIKDDGVWQVSAPLIQKFDEETGDPIGDPQPIKAPEATLPIRLMLWDAPTIEMWNSIYIPGTYTKKDAKGNETEVSKNWLQQAAQKAVNWEGSALQMLIATVEGDLPSTAPEMPEDEQEAPSSDEDSLIEDEAPDAAPTASEDDDPLADLGL